MIHGTFVLALGTPAAALAQAEATTVTPTILTPVSTVSGLDFELPQGTFRYGATASEIFQFGYYGDQGTTESTNLSGNLAYASKSVVHPFSAVYSGGVELSNQAGYGTSFFQSLSLTQSYLTRHWSFSLSDSVSYLPQSPTVGLSGIPGTGDLGLDPVVSTVGPAQNVLTYNSNRVSNVVIGSFTNHLTGRTSLSGDASYNLLHFFGASTLDNHDIGADLALNHQLDARTSLGVAANYTIFSYTAALQDATFQTRSVGVQGSRQLSRSLSVAGSVGPQWISGSSSLGIAPRLTTTAGASLTYVKRFGTSTLSYGRGTNGGSGVLPGAFSDSVTASFSRIFGRDWSTALNAGYARTTGLGEQTTPDLAVLGLANHGTFDSTFGGAQANRRLTGSLAAFASYSASSQSYGNYAEFGNSAHGALNGIVQSFAIGVSFYPKSLLPGLF